MSQTHLENALLRLHSDEDFQQFVGYLQDRLAVSKTDLMAMPDNLNFYRTQGEALCLTYLLDQIESVIKQNSPEEEIIPPVF